MPPDSTAQWRWHPFVASVAILALTALALHLMGRYTICVCGTIKPWYGSVLSSENSQHLTDWYSFSHVLHGFIFYALLWWLRSGWSVAWRFVAALAIEAGWEIAENSPVVIDRYRTATISLDYYGDTIVNSLADIAAMALGFAIAALAPLWFVVAWALTSEAGMAYMIRDNLLLNIVMLIHPVDAIKAWQAAGQM